MIWRCFSSRVKLVAFMSYMAYFIYIYYKGHDIIEGKMDGPNILKEHLNAPALNKGYKKRIRF